MDITIINTEHIWESEQELKNERRFTIGKPGFQKINTLEYFDETGWSIVTEHWHEGHLSDTSYDDLGRIPESEAEQIFFRSINKEI